ncbi:hypothetical protein ACWGIA_23740 [Streptomyces bobili]
MELTPDEVKLLTDLPDAAHEVKVHLLCELEDGHAGAHWALGQTQDRGADADCTQWWLRWAAGSQEWAHNVDCPEEAPDADEFCLLPVGHEGAHSWG